MRKGAAGACFRGQFDIRIREDNRAGFPPQFQQHGFQVLARRGGHDPADRGAAGKTDFLHARVLDQRRGHVGGILRPVFDHVETAVRETGLVKDGGDGPIASRRSLRSFQHRGVPRRQGV